MSGQRVAIVTGAARGIGAATVLTLAEQGWSVLAVDLARDDPALPYPMGTADELAEVVAPRGRLGPRLSRRRPRSGRAHCRRR